MLSDFLEMNKNIVCFSSWITILCIIVLFFVFKSDKKENSESKLWKWIYNKSTTLFVIFWILFCTSIFIGFSFREMSINNIIKGSVQNEDAYKIYINPNIGYEYYKTQCIQFKNDKNICIINNNVETVSHFEKVDIDKNTKYICIKDSIEYYAKEYNENENYCIDSRNIKLFNVDGIGEIEDINMDLFK